MEIINIDPKELKAAEYNPRQMTERQVKDLTESVRRFGIVDPFIVNKHEGRENIVIGGHQRLKIALSEGINPVPVVYFDFDIEKEKELNLRLNKNLGEWDWDLLANFDELLLKDVGFNEDEMNMQFGLNDADNVIVSEERLDVLSIEPPESPKLKERVSLECGNIENYKKIKEAVNSGKLSIESILNII